MRRMTLHIGLMLLFVAIYIVAVPALGGHNASGNVSYKAACEKVACERLILNILLDKAGKAFITGYAQDLSRLPFLKPKQYQYENNTSQLDVLTDVLTHKDGSLWVMEFAPYGHFDYIHLTFCLPRDAEINNISCTQGLQCFVYTTDVGLIADINGHDLLDPYIAIEYQQPSTLPSLPPSPETIAPPIELAPPVKSDVSTAVFQTSAPPNPLLFSPDKNADVPAARKEPIKVDSKGSSNELHQISGLILILVLGSILIIIVRKGPSEIASKSMQEDITPVGAVEPDFLCPDLTLEPEAAAPMKMVIGSEMNAVMETLTAKERAILQALIDAGGVMTQADLRSMTKIPKSSLSDMLLSLNDRKIITKKECGRTNVIELSEWLLSKNKPS